MRPASEVLWEGGIPLRRASAAAQQCSATAARGLYCTYVFIAYSIAAPGAARGARPPVDVEMTRRAIFCAAGSVFGGSLAVLHSAHAWRLAAVLAAAQAAAGAEQ